MQPPRPRSVVTLGCDIQVFLYLQAFRLRCSLKMFTTKRQRKLAGSKRALYEELVNSEMLVFYENKPGGGKVGRVL